MNRKILCVLIACVILFAAFIPFAYADDVILYSSDGRTVRVSPEDVNSWRTKGWFQTPEDAKIITMYAMDGRTLDIPQYYREDYLKVGWYNNREEVVQMMYTTDGRTQEVYKASAAAQHAEGWYYNISDVSVKMYDKDGIEHTVFKDHIEQKTAEGLSTDKNDVMQLMFSIDNRFIHVPLNKVTEYENVGWYRAGGKIDASRPMVALTFDDGPGKYTDAILSILEKYNARATFFVQGKNVAGYKSVVQRAVSLGNEIGNHTWSHINLSSSSSGTISQQISSTNTAVFQATGIYPKLYRPPYGAYNKSVLNCVPMAAVMWSVDTLDWKTRNPQKTLASVAANTKDGSIILMHDIHSPTADAVESVVRFLLMSKYQLVTVSELIEARQGVIVNGKVYNSINP